MKTFRQIADENHKDRTTIFKRAKKIPNFKAKHLTKKNGKWFVNDSGVKLLIERKNVRPRKYKSRINTKYDYWKLAKSRGDMIKWLRSQMTKVIANNTQLAKSNQKLANQSKSNQKKLAGQKSANPELPEHYSPAYDKQEQEIADLKNDNHKLRHKLASRPKHQSFLQRLLEAMKK